MRRVCLLICVIALFVPVKVFATAMSMTPVNTRMSIAPGKNAKQVIELKNRSYSLKNFDIFSSGYHVTADGKPVFSSGSHTAEKWITVTPKLLKVRPYDFGVVRFKVDVPASAAPGSYLAAVMLRTAPDKPKKKKGEAKEESKAQFKIGGQFGHIVYIDVGNPTYKAQIESFGVHQIKGKPKFVFRVKNQGNYNYPAKGVIKIESGGKKIKDVSTGQAMVVRGASRTIEVAMPKKLAPGTYQALLSLHLSKSQKLEARATFTIASQ